jgi:hypothetical protein
LFPKINLNARLDGRVLGAAVRSNGFPSGHTDLHNRHPGLCENFLKRVLVAEVPSISFGPKVVEDEASENVERLSEVIEATSVVGEESEGIVATPLWAKCEGEAHTPKSGNLESSGTPKNLELELKGQNTSHWGVLGVIGKVLKCTCLNWPRIGHLDICSPSYGQKKGRESNWRPLKVENRPLPDVR